MTAKKSPKGNVPTGPKKADLPGVTPLPAPEKKPAPGSIDPLKPRKSPTGVGDSTPTTIDTNLERKVGTANPTSVPGKGTIKG